MDNTKLLDLEIKEQVGIINDCRKRLFDAQEALTRAQVRLIEIRRYGSAQRHR